MFAMIHLCMFLLIIKIVADERFSQLRACGPTFRFATCQTCLQKRHPANAKAKQMVANQGQKVTQARGWLRSMEAKKCPNPTQEAKLLGQRRSLQVANHNASGDVRCWQLL